MIKRLTRKMMGQVLLPSIPMEIKSKSDLEKYHEVRREYENMAIKLSEYEDRDEIEDCPYCCGDVDNRNYLLSNGDAGVYIDGNNKLVTDDECEFESRKINYCPECGRKL